MNKLICVFWSLSISSGPVTLVISCHKWLAQIFLLHVSIQQISYNYSGSILHANLNYHVPRIAEWKTELNMLKKRMNGTVQVIMEHTVDTNKQYQEIYKTMSQYTNIIIRVLLFIGSRFHHPTIMDFSITLCYFESYYTSWKRHTKSCLIIWSSIE